ncbi:MAG: hypothetical protein ACI9Y1_002258, partial [Lentisphaeria bacterium]
LLFMGDFRINMEQETALFFSACTGLDVILWHYILA